MIDNCSIKKLHSDPICHVCEPTYYFKNNSCIQTTGDATLANGCFFSNYLEDTCWICHNKYYMNSEAKCVLIEKEIIDVVEGFS